MCYMCRLICALIGAVVLDLSWSGRVLALESNLKLVVSIAPAASLVRELAGATVSVDLIAQDARDPHTFEPRPSDLKRLFRADAVVLISPGFETWADGLELPSSSKLIWLAGENVDQKRDVHYWLTPRRMIFYGENLTSQLCQISPAKCDMFKSNYAIYKERLLRLDESVRKRITTWTRTTFVAEHPAWEAFAADYGLTQLAVLRAGEVDQISPRQLARLLSGLPKNQRTVFIVEQSGLRTTPEEFLTQSGLKPVVLDSFGTIDTSYEDLILANVSKLELAMRDKK